MCVKPSRVSVLPVMELSPHPEVDRIFLPLTPGEQGEITAAMQRGDPFQPLLVDREKRILAGAENWLAARDLGWPHISAITAPPLNPGQTRALIVAENVSKRELREEHTYRGMNNFFDMEPLRPRGGW